MTETGYPRIQISFFVQGGGQIVIRGDSADEVVEVFSDLVDEPQAGGESPISSVLNNMVGATTAAKLIVPEPAQSSGGNGNQGSSSRGEYRGRGTSQSSSSSSPQSGDRRCPDCGKATYVREGQTNGRDWTGYFCTENRKHKATFVN